jgi:hypothetical protein
MAKKKALSRLTIIGREEAPKPVIEAAEIKPVLTFEAWWMLKQYEKRLRPELKSVIEKHFKARGFWDNKEFDKGLADFGI